MLKQLKKLLLSSTAALACLPEPAHDAICPEPPDFTSVSVWAWSQPPFNLKGERV